MLTEGSLRLKIMRQVQAHFNLSIHIGCYFCSLTEENEEKLAKIILHVFGVLKFGCEIVHKPFYNYAQQTKHPFTCSDRKENRLRMGADSIFFTSADS